MDYIDNKQIDAFKNQMFTGFMLDWKTIKKCNKCQKEDWKKEDAEDMGKAGTFRLRVQSYKCVCVEYFVICKQCRTNGILDIKTQDQFELLLSPSIQSNDITKDNKPDSSKLPSCMILCGFQSCAFHRVFS